MRKLKRVNYLFFLNTIAYFIPALLSLIIIFLITLNKPILSQNFCHDVNSIEEMQGSANYGRYNIRITTQQLVYTGYDYYENDRRVGAYYYTLLGDKNVFFLLKTKNPKPIVDHYSVKGKMISNSPTMEYMMNQYTDELGIEYKTLTDLTFPYVISEVDYPYFYNIAMVLLVIVPYGMAGWVILCCATWIMNPSRHPNAKQLSAFGDKKYVLQELNAQCKNQMVYHSKNCDITKEYLIIFSIFRTDIIRMDYIQYLSKHAIAKKRLIPQHRTIYRITMSNPEKMFYDHDFYSEEELDEVIKIIMQLYPNINDRLEHSISLDNPQKEDVGEAGVSKQKDSIERELFDTKTELEISEKPEMVTIIEQIALNEQEKLEINKKEDQREQE